MMSLGLRVGDDCLVTERERASWILERIHSCIRFAVDGLSEDSKFDQFQLLSLSIEGDVGGGRKVVGGKQCRPIVCNQDIKNIRCSLELVEEFEAKTSIKFNQTA